MRKRPTTTKEQLLADVTDAAQADARLNIPLPADLHHLIRLQALEERESVAAITRRLWCEYLRRQGKTPPPA